MQKVESDFLTWTSFPSSLKLVNDEADRAPWLPWFINIPVTPGSTIKATMQIKETNALTPIHPIRGVILYTSPVPAPKYPEGYVYFCETSTPLGTHNWMPVNVEKPIPAGHHFLHSVLTGPAGRPEYPMSAWFDDLKIYQDGALIYADDFSKWDPVIGAGIGAPIGGAIGYFLKEPLGPMVSEAVGAVVGGAVGGGVGLLTGLGIIPVPQIPSLGAAPEGPGAPARLGKYQITG